jgi:hypothetical protein
MHSSRRLVPAAIFAAILIRPLSALEIVEYDKLSLGKRRDYNIALVLGTLSLLESTQAREDASKFRALFGIGTEATKTPPKGVAAFMGNLETARNLDRRNGLDAKRLHVEHALMLTMKQNGIAPPSNILSIMAGGAAKDAPTDSRASFALFLAFSEYDLSQMQSAADAAMERVHKRLEAQWNSALVLSDGRRVAVDDRGEALEFYEIYREGGIGPKLTGAAKAEAERVLKCRTSKGRECL